MGRLAEDGAIPAAYPLTETDSADYDRRTRLNVRDSDATLILNAGAVDGGTLATLDLARAMAKPHLVVDLDGAPSPDAVAAWLARTRPRVLNVAGPRESKRPGVQDAAAVYLRRLFALTRPT